MSTTVTQVAEPKYEYFFQDNSWNNKREVLTGSKAQPTFTEIPQVDIGDIFSGDFSKRLAKAEEIAHVCKTVGFMYIKNHGVDQDFIDEVFERSRQYHAQPLDVKMKEDVYKSPTLRGYEFITKDYESNGAKTLSAAKKGSFLYSYECDNDPQPPTLTPEQRALCLGEWNQWPTHLPEFKSKLLRYQAEILIIARALMRSFALGLGAEETYFDSMITAPFVSIILQHYPPHDPSAVDPTSLGAHSDFETFTILNQDMVGGLEVLNKNGMWVPAVPVRGTFVVNVGDFLQRISNDTFVSTIHRVRNMTGNERYSIPFFFGFNMDQEVAVLPSCISETRPKKYEPRNLNEYTANRRKIQKEKHEAAMKGMA